jgi:hypothetical protein
MGGVFSRHFDALNIEGERPRLVTVFVIETKNFNGWIYGDEHVPQWSVSHFGKKFQFQNPCARISAIPNALPSNCNSIRQHATKCSEKK